MIRTVVDDVVVGNGVGHHPVLVPGVSELP